MGMETVVVLQSDRREAQECAEHLAEMFNVIEVTDDAKVALESVRANKPDFLITSVTLKHSDGMAVIEFAKSYSPDTCAIVLSVMDGDELVKQVMEAGAAYYMIKPVDYSMLIKRMAALSKTQRADLVIDKQIEERVSRIFIGMGMPPHIKGYNYLREGIRLAVEEPEIINSITKRLYPSIGVRFNTSASKVERAIRHAIEVAWNKGHIDTINSLFGVNAYSESEKPTNSEFIALIADRLLLDGVAG